MYSIYQFTGLVLFAVFVNVILFNLLFHIFEYLESSSGESWTVRFSFIISIYWVVPLFFTVLLLLGWATFPGINIIQFQGNGKSIALMLTLLMSINLVSLARISSQKRHPAIRNFIMVQIVLFITLTMFLTLFGYLSKDIWLVASDNLAKMVERDTPLYALVSSSLACVSVEIFIKLDKV